MPPPQAQLLVRRLANQLLSQPRFETPEAIVSWLGAVQAQEYAPAKWALGLRSKTLTDDIVERAMTSGEILRTHVLRPTWHFVTRRDIRWLLELTAPHVSARMAPYNRQLELDRKIFARSHDAIARALTYWSSDDAPAPRAKPTAHLLPIYDEYLIAYKNRDVAFDPRARDVDSKRRDDFGHYLVIDGRFAGTWRWQIADDGIHVRTTPYRRLTASESRRLTAVAKRMREFASRSVTMAPSS